MIRTPSSDPGDPSSATRVGEAPTLVALDATFSLRVSDRDLGARLADVFRALLGEGPAGHVITVERGQEGEAAELSVDGRIIGATASFVGLVDALVSVLNQAAIAESGRYLLLHAAAAELAERVVLLPAESGSGKSTLVKHLVEDGFGYVSDEIVAIDPATLSVVPYPKPLILDAVVAPPPGATGGEISLIVSPLYRPGGGTFLRPLVRSQAVLLLAENSFNFHDHGAGGLGALARLARQCETFRLDIDDSAPAIAQIRSRLSGAA
jgi:hypothetical protein